jgi:hypothetical protein
MSISFAVRTCDSLHLGKRKFLRCRIANVARKDGDKMLYVDANNIENTFEAF